MCMSRAATAQTGSVVAGVATGGRPSKMEELVSEASAATGDSAVDGALTVLETLDERTLPEHVTVFEAIQAALAERLAET